MNGLIQGAGGAVMRLQVPRLHAGHRYLIDQLRERHEHTVIIVGTSRALTNDRYPLSLTDVTDVIHDAYPDILVRPQRDCRTPEHWTLELDASLSGIYDTDFVLYGSRDSFIPKYSGVFKTCMIDPIASISGTDLRELIRRGVAATHEYTPSELMRMGKIHTELHRTGRVYPTVDGIIENEDGDILLVYKEGDPGWRLPGGFAEPTDPSMEFALLREVDEEGGVKIKIVRIIGTYRVDDWRYRHTKDRIMTTLYHARHISGALKINDTDEIAKLKWEKPARVREALVPEHVPLWDMFTSQD